MTTTTRNSKFGQPSRQSPADRLMARALKAEAEWDALLALVREWVVAEEDEEMDTFCHVCDRHAPKDAPDYTGKICGPVPHADDCRLARSRALLAQIDGGSAR